MSEHFKDPEKIQLSNEQIANLSDAQFKTLVIKKLTELGEFGCKLQEKMKAMLRNKGKCTGNQQGWEGNWDSNQWCGPEGRKKHPTRKE